METLKKIVLCILFACSLGCVKDVDFDQLDDAEVHSNYLVSLAHFTIDAPELLNELNEEIPIHFDVIQTAIDDSGEKYLEKIEFTTKASNEFSRAFTIRVILYNANQEPIYTLTPDIVIPPFSVDYTTVIEIPTEDISNIYEAHYFGFFFTIEPSSDGSIINPNDTSQFIFQSAMELFFNFRQV